MDDETKPSLSYRVKRPEEVKTFFERQLGGVTQIMEAGSTEELWKARTEYVGDNSAVGKLLGLCQLVKRRNLFKVDSSILVLGGFYIIVFVAYLFFEFFIVNYRPVLINGFVMMQFSRLITNNKARKIVNISCGAFTGFMVIGRLLSGVHWFTDILVGTLLSTALVMFYFSVNRSIESKKQNK